MSDPGRGPSPRAAAAGSFTLRELETYWQETHRQIAQERGLAPAIVEGNPWIVNRFDDFAHRLGMRANFRRLGNLEGRRVLDLGCGRGRWAEEFARRGARVTGIDWSEEALAQARRRVPQATFVRMPVTDLGFAAGSFDVVNCVTVVQHLPHEVQARVLREAARVLVLGGWFSLVELTASQAGPHVFPRAVKEWVALARESGFAAAGVRGCCYELVFRPYKAAMELLRGRPGNLSSTAGVGARQGVTWRQKANRLLMAGLALPAFPVELFSQALPAGMATHAAMVFRRGAGSDQQ
jgi:ubiquinone/menaquinone biosynthesis C-methylase UbiE